MKKCISAFFYVICVLTLGVFAQNSEPIKIGVFLDMTGETSSFGVSAFTGIQLAINEINARGGIDGRQIEIVVENSEGKQNVAIAVVKKLINDDNVVALIGDATSNNTLAAAPIAQAAKIPLITPTSTAEGITKIGNYIFRACFVDSFQGVAMADFAYHTLKLRKIAVLTDANSTYAKGLSETFVNTFTKLGGKIVAHKQYAAGEENYDPQLKSFKLAKPDGIYISGYYKSVGEVAKQVRSLKINVPLLGGDGWDSPDLFRIAENSLNNSYITNHFSPDIPNEKVKNFSTTYKKLFGLDADAFSALAYDSVYLMTDAIKLAKSTDGDKIRAAMAGTKDFDGVTGKTTINSDRNAVKAVVIQKLQYPNFIYQASIQP